jgi:serine/threonine protein phosphatase PrpC
MQHPRRHEVLRCVGAEERAGGEDFVDIVSADFLPEHAFLLCSDGLSDLLTSSRLLELVLAHAESPKALVGALVDQANAAGGKDNVTAVFVMGDGFREAVKSTRSGSAPDYKEWVIKVLLSRWAVLLYGLILGAAGMLLNRR